MMNLALQNYLMISLKKNLNLRKRNKNDYY
nr:MAG TPA: hypothetical protein [Caudoviricetes sp.]DAE39855.1 MAG TPA: hypothetical protein [Caudoviricetes sp.]